MGRFVKFRIIAVSLMTLALCFSTAFAVENYIDGDIDKFYSFSDYLNERGTGLPDEWSLQNGAVKSVGVGSVQDEERTGNVMKIEGGNAPGVLFGSIFSSGKLHLSYDIKQVGDTDYADTTYKKGMLLNINGDPYLDDKNETPDLTIDDPAVWSTKNGYGHWLFDTGSQAADEYMSAREYARRWMGNQRFAKKYFDTEKWHKVDIFIDKDHPNQYFYVYLDGEYVAFYDGSTERQMSLAVNEVTAKLKGVIFSVDTPSKSSDKGGFVMDNVYLKSYKSDGIYDDSVSVITDDGVGDGLQRSSGVLNVGFSEYMNRPVTKADISIKNFQTGASVTDFTIENADNMQFDICFGGSVLAAGKYTITVENVVGNITGLPVKDKAVFNTVVEKVNVDGTEVEIPWLDDIEFVTYDGKTSKIGSKVPTTTKTIKVRFSAPVANDDLANKIQVTQNGIIHPFESITMEDGNKTVCLNLDTFMPADAEYNISVDSSMHAYASSEVPILSGYNNTFMTANDGILAVADMSYMVTGKGAGRKGTLSLDIVKTNNNTEKYTLFLAAYTEVYDSVLDKNVKRMTKLGGEAISFESYERTTKSGKVSVNVADVDNAELHYYLISYPEQKCISKGRIVNGEIEN